MYEVVINNGISHRLLFDSNNAMILVKLKYHFILRSTLILLQILKIISKVLIMLKDYLYIIVDIQIKQIDIQFK